MKIGIMNISLGNVGSVASAFRFYGHDAALVGDPAGIAGLDLIVLAGVGNFQFAARRVCETGFADALNEAVLVRKRLVLGSCLGMHLFADEGREDGDNPGLGWIPGEVVRIERPAGSSLRVPHMGWNVVTPRNTDLFRRIRGGEMYFMHSYRFLPQDRSVITAVTDYGGVEIVSAVRKDNIVGVQFHPEKSQGHGLRFLRNLLEEIQ
jgi:glutamine amidotransferase